MTWYVAVEWVSAYVFRGKLLGIWRARRGPGPFSIFVEDGETLLELWSTPTGQLHGKRSRIERLLRSDCRERASDLTAINRTALAVLAPCKRSSHEGSHRRVQYGTLLTSTE